MFCQLLLNDNSDDYGSNFNHLLKCLSLQTFADILFATVAK